ncbi:MAG: ATP-binding protein [Clostridiales Family XIII bacterium]|jgi:AAA+ ATPase superfamily predicted ATPase|nr:ATP-binding protein [Clostridiales Family XIII bacterium]
MKFYDRSNELALLEENRQVAEHSANFTLLIGRRRVGKTALIVESLKNQKSLYLFVSRKSEVLLCEEFQLAAAEALDIQILGKADRFGEFFGQLLKYSEENSFTLVIDEFQDFERVNKSIFSEIQNLWDKHRAKSKINFIACGSIYSMMTRLFEDEREPLFGRLTSKIVLQPFATGVIKQILGDHNPRWKPEDLLCLYMLTGGTPKYVSLLMDRGATTKAKMLKYLCGGGSPLLTDGKDVLISEFGKDYTTYFSILQLIASGKTSQSEIDSIVGKNTGAYLHNLEREYTLIERNKPIFSKPESRNIKWRIRDNYLRFWFRFVYANQSLVETEKYELLHELIERDYQQYSGLILEDYFRKKLMEEGPYSSVGSSWDNKGTNEIDVVALNELSNEALVAEVKTNPKHISMSTLESKAASIAKPLEKYKVDYAAFSLADM